MDADVIVGKLLSMKSKAWRLLDTGPGRGSFNMALDEALFLRAIEGKTPPTIRFYAWSPPAVSLGYFQPWEGEIDLVRCREQGVELYRRITGGRAVLHDDEVTYSVVAGPGEVGTGGGEGILPTYLRISSALAAGLEGMGLAISLAPHERRAMTGRTGGAGASHHPVCFSSPSGYEIICEGQKIVGSALKRHGGGFLQHGSVLLGGHGKKLAALLGEKYRVRGAEDGGTAAKVGLRDLLGGSVCYREVVSALADGFARVWETELIPGVPDAGELGLAAKLEKEKYLSQEWNLRPGVKEEITGA
jgi:lipoyl(octanoyl) transferase